MQDEMQPDAASGPNTIGSRPPRRRLHFSLAVGLAEVCALCGLMAAWAALGSETLDSYLSNRSQVTQIALLDDQLSVQIGMATRQAEAMVTQNPSIATELAAEFAPMMTDQASASSMLSTLQASGERPLSPEETSPLGVEVLYESDWSDGLSGWFGSSDWKSVNGMLVSDGTNNDSQLSITAPYAITVTPDYAIEAEIQVLRSGGCSSFGLVARAEEDRRGYRAGVNYCEFDGASLWDFPDIPHVPYDPGTAWHTYRLQVVGNALTFIIDGTPVISAIDNRYLAPGRVGLWSDEVQLNVRRFSVALPHQ